jgi:predicted PurR-regulated permease PerM
MPDRPQPGKVSEERSMTALEGFSPVARGLIVAAAVAIVVIAVEAAAPIIAPILLAAFVAVIASSPLRWMQRRGVPKWIALGLIVFVLLDVGSIIALISTGALEGLRDSLPGYQERLILLSEQLGGWLERLGVQNAGEATTDILDPAVAMALVRAALANAGGVFASGLLILLAVVFMLLEASGMLAKLRAAFRLDAAAEDRLTRLLDSLNQYMRIKILTSLGTAVCIWIWVWFLGIDFAVLWAVLAFFLNFIPFVGAFLMAIPAILVALVQTDLGTTLLVAAGYLVVNTAIGSVLEPRIMGRGLGISTLAVFLSLLFWSWVLGTVGAFLSVPLTMALIIAFEASPHTRPIAVLLGPQVSPTEGTGDEAAGSSGPDSSDQVA